MPSLGGLLLAASALTVPFGTTVEVRLATNPEGVSIGSVVGDFLVVSPPRPTTDGGVTVGLKPLALGALPVPLAGEPNPAVVEVRSTLTAGARPAPPLFPSPPALPWWPAIAVIGIGLAGWAAWRALHPRRRVAPLDALRDALAPLVEPAGWTSTSAADLLARECREFLREVLGSPCPGMTTREVTQLMAGSLQAPHGLPFGAALALADDVRFAGGNARPDQAVAVVREVLAAAEALQQERRAA